ncbi:hypothetical protein F4781DRAFT_440069 [Annulohypoxylon bovei var. microspora]|nr:hypothetical protein F4781DRAFT_440069 [Annulohypoxylon bovei var. microspora]
MAVFVFVTSCLMFVSSLLSIGLRLYSKNLTKAGLGWDDGLIVVSAVITVALFGLSIHLWDIGWSRDSLQDLGYDEHTILTLLLLFEVMYLLAMCLAKLSAVYLYARIFIQDKFRLMCKIAGAMVILVYITMFVEAVTISDIAIALWKDPVIGAPANMQAADLAISILNVVGNLAILLIPIPPIWKLQMKVKTKINLTILFCLGICVAVVSCIRLSLVIHQNYGLDSLIAYGSRDMHLHVLEPELAIFSLSLPVLHPLWVKLRERFYRTGEQSPDNHKMRNMAPVSRENENESPVSWRDVIGGDSSKYDVYIYGGTSKSTATKKGQSPNRQRSRPSFAMSPHKQPKPPQLAHITVDKSWSVSYESASFIH